MKKRLVFFMVLGLLALAAFVYGQPDTTATDPTSPKTVLDWVVYIIGALSLALNGWLNTKRVKLSKAVPVLQALIDALEGNKSSVGPGTIQAMSKGKEIIESEA